MTPRIDIRPLTLKERYIVNERRKALNRQLRNVPEHGIEVEYLDKTFWVAQGVSWPHADSRPIIEHFSVDAGDRVLDMCTGSGVIAIFAALRGAAKVVAVDINPNAIHSVEVNAARHHVRHIVQGVLSDVWSAVSAFEKFDVITCSPPLTDLDSTSLADEAARDTGLRIPSEFFKRLAAHLKPLGRVYISKTNCGNIKDMYRLADEAGFSVRLIGKQEDENSPLVYYAFELIQMQK